MGDSGIPAGDALIDLVFTALDHGIDSVSEGGPLIPFVLAESGAERSISRFAADTLEEGLAQARRHAGSSGAERVAVAYDGYLTLEGERADAIFVQAQERGADSSVVFAQRYRPGGRLRKFAVMGNAAFAGAGEDILRG